MPGNSHVPFGEGPTEKDGVQYLAGGLLNFERPLQCGFWDSFGFPSLAQRATPSPKRRHLVLRRCPPGASEHLAFGFPCRLTQGVLARGNSGDAA